LLSKSLHLFCKNCYGILECSIFGLVVRDGRRGGDGGGSESGRRDRDGTGGGSALCNRFSLKAGKIYPREVAGAAAVVADRRTGMFLQAVLVRLRAAATTAILYLLTPLLDNVLVGQSLEVGINIVGINIHCVGIAETGSGARSRRRIVTGSACLALVVLQVGDLQVDGVAIGLQRGVVFCHDQEVRQPIDVIGVQGLLETIKQILVGPTGTRSPGLEIGYKLTESALALLHPDDLVLRISLRTDWLKFQFERREKGVPVCKRRLAFCKRFYVGSGLYSCVLDHEREGRGDYFMNI
jgi:hypothetical protein